MAATARTTGADAQAEELRRRNVAAQSTAPVVAEVPTTEKSKVKPDEVRSPYARCIEAFSPRAVAECNWPG